MGWKDLLYVAAGGGLGSALRTWIGFYAKGSFPWSTLFVNVSGSFLIGALFNLIGQEQAESGGIRYFLIAGLCGGFTTFSAFSLETFQQFREGHAGSALANVALSLVCCLAATVAGYRLTADC